MKNIFYKRIVFVLFLVNSFGISSAQKYDHLMYIEPLQIIGFTNSSLDFGYINETRLFKNDLGIAFILPFDVWGSSAQYETGRKDGVGFEIKYTPSVYLNRHIFLGVYNGYIFHKYDSHRLEDLNSDIVVSYNVQQSEISNFLVIGYSEMGYGGFASVSLGMGIRSILVSNDSSIDVNSLSPLYRLSDYFERESNGWHYLFGLKLSVKYGLDMRRLVH